MQKNVTLRLDEDLIERVRAEAARSRRSVNNLVAILVEEGLPEEPEDEPELSRKSSSVKLGDWTVWWEKRVPVVINVCAPQPKGDEAGRFVNPYGGTPGNGKPGTDGLWIRLHASDPSNKNLWNRCVHAFEETGQEHPPYIP